MRVKLYAKSVTGAKRYQFLQYADLPDGVHEYRFPVKQPINVRVANSEVALPTIDTNAVRVFRRTYRVMEDEEQLPVFLEE